MIIDVVIPAFNEEQSIGNVLKDIPWDVVREVIVADNNSKDDTAKVAKENGATVVFEPKSGYGRACLKGLAHISNKKEKPDVVVFMDGDYSDYPEQLIDVVAPIKEGFDLVIGVRVGALREKGAMTPQQVMGNLIASKLIKLLYKHTYRDLGPFRAIRYSSLELIEMEDQDYGWTVEMQLKALKFKLAITEVDVKYRKRIGISKVSGTLKGTVLAGYKIISKIIKYR